MKRLLTLTLVILVLATAPAYAALKILPEDVQERLHNLALEAYPDYQVEESWVQEFPALGQEVFRVVLVKGAEKAEAYIDVSTETALTEAEFDEIVAAEAAAQEEEPIFTTLGAEDTGSVITDGAEAADKNVVPWLVGGLVALALAGGIAFYMKKK